MAVILRSKACRLLLLGAAWAAIGLYTVVCLRQYRASRLMTQLSPKALEQAARLEPWNADIRWKLGRYFLLMAQDSQAAQREFEAALALNPHAARYWLDTAAAYQISGNLQGERRAIENALALDPTSPNVAWEAANSYLVLNDLAPALRLLRVVMKNDPARFESALIEAWRTTKDVDVVLTQAIAPEAGAYLALLNLLIRQGETASAKLVWQRLIALQQPFPISSAFPYFDYLVRAHEVSEAVKTWQELRRRSHIASSSSEMGNLVSNGGFEENFLNGGFDWRFTPSEGVEVSIDHRQFHAGARSLKTWFEGPAVERIGVLKYIPVHPDTSYRFSVYCKAEELESASGPRIEISDAYSQRAYLLTDDILGSDGWRQQSGEFHTGPESSLLTLKIVRQPADSLIKGAFWIDDVTVLEH
jgi:tetratricopeptide (TPR) repeat protein